jgi:hypothetical protein
MQTVEQLSKLPCIADPAIRDWVDARWRDALAAGAEVCFHLLEPAEPPIPTLWAAVAGAADPPSLDGLAATFEYVVDHGAFFEVVIPANHESAVIALVPTGGALEPSWLEWSPWS